MSRSDIAEWIDSLQVPPRGGPKLKHRAPRALRPEGERNGGETLSRASIERVGRRQHLLHAADRAAGLGRCGRGRRDPPCRHRHGSPGRPRRRLQATREEEAAHGILWRARRAAPRRDQIASFNPSRYEDAPVTRMHETISKCIRVAHIEAFGAPFAAKATAIFKVFLHPSREQQLARFRKRPEGPARRWMIAESDCCERGFWKDCGEIHEETQARASRPHAPWYAAPADRKRVRNRGIADRLEARGLAPPPVRVDLADIRRRFHAAGKDEL